MNKLAFLILLCGAQFALAQEKLFQFPSGPATWTVTCAQKGAAAPTAAPPDSANPSDKKPAALKRIEVAQTDEVRRSIIHWSDGQSRELWSLPKMTVILTEDPNGRAFASHNSPLFGDPFSPSGFDWIKPATRTSEEPIKYDGVECYHYAGTVEVPDPFGFAPPTTISCQAWINAETKLPVALLKGYELGRFSFGPPPEALEMPEKFRKRLDYYKVVMGIK